MNGRVVEEVEPLGFDLSRDRFGATALPGTSGLQDALREALARPEYQASLGRARVRIQETRVRVPVQVDLGITDWLTVGATVPLVKRRSEVAAVFRSDTASADLGVSPTVGSPSAPQLFLQSLSGAVDAMAARAESLCSAGPDSAECLGARAALGDGRSFLDALSRAYDARFFPFAGSGTGGALRARLGLLGNRFSVYGVTSVPGPESLPLADGPLGEGGLQRLAADPEVGVAGDSIRTWQSLWEMGDVELHGAVRLLERRPPDTAGFFDRPTLLLGVGGLVRLATGVPHDPDNFVDLGSGDGQMDVEVRVFGDLGFARRVGVWADVRYGVQMEGEVTRRIAPPDVVLAPASTRAPVTWNPGDYLELEVAPRWRLTPELAAAARYRFFRKGMDRYSLAGPVGTAGTGGEPLEPSLLERETGETLHEVGLSLVYSTLAASRTGRAGLPLEARVRYRRAVAGSGGLTRRGSRYEAGLRLFWRLWGD